MRLEFPLIGRGAEMRAIGAAISSPEIAGAVLRGPVGAGKSRIVREALSAAQSRGHQTRWTVGTSAGSRIPLGAFGAWAPAGAADSVQLLRAVIEALTGAPPGSKAVLAVDDAHLLDDLSIFVVHQIVQRGAAKVLLTICDGEPVPTAVREILKAGQFDRVALRQLSATDTAALLTASLAGEVDSEAAQRLWEITAGNPLYLRTIVEHELADGRLVHDGRRWRWMGDATMPPGLVEMVESRLGTVSEAVSDVVDALAVAEPIELGVLTGITDGGGIEEAETRGLVRLEKTGRDIQVRLAHPLYGEVRRKRAPVSRLRRLGGLIAERLGTSGNHDDIAVVVRRGALHLESDLPPDPDLFASAAQGAVWLGELHLAERLAEAAINAGAGLECSLLRAHALSWSGRGHEAEAVFAAIPTEQLSDRERATCAFLRSSNMLWAVGDAARAKELIDQALRTAPQAARTPINAFLAVYWFGTDQPDATMRVSASLAREQLPVVSTELAWVLTQTLGDAGRTAEAISAAEEGYAAATGSLDAPQMVFNIADAEVGALLLAGQVADAVAAADRAYRRAVELPATARLLGLAVAGRAALGAGDLARACTLLGQAADGLSLSHATGWGYRYRIPHVTALAITGAAGEAAAHLATLEKVERKFRPMDYELQLARAWVAAAQGAVTEAIALALSAAQRAASAQRFAAEVACRLAAVQFGDHGPAPRLRELELIVEGPRAGLAARFAEALRSGQAVELAILSEEFERMGDLIAAIDAAAHAGAAHRRQGRRGSALSCSTRADALAERCGAVTPALRAVAVPLPLSDREREIVALVGAGMSNRAVAERLTLSVRTVESHIFRAMRKTGAANRDELAALLRGGKAP